LVADKTSVVCTLLSRRVSKKQLDLFPEAMNEKETTTSTTYRDPSSARRTQHSNQKWRQVADQYSPSSSDVQQIAVCFIKYRPGLSLLRKDLGATLVNYGRAGIASSGIHVDIPSMPTIHGSMQVKSLRSDAAYVESLGRLGFEAVKESRGMWSDENIRKERPDLVEEAEFEGRAGFIHKLWRRIRS